jgi:hypothetical protein
VLIIDSMIRFHTRQMELPPDLLQVVEEIGGGAWTRTTDLRIMRPSL